MADDENWFFKVAPVICADSFKLKFHLEQTRKHPCDRKLASAEEMSQPRLKRRQMTAGEESQEMMAPPGLVAGNNPATATATPTKQPSTRQVGD